MCFGFTHNCVVTCINGYLNESALQQGIVKSTNEYLPNMCKIACEQGVAIMDSGDVTIATMIVGNPPLLGLLVLICILIVVCIIVLGRDEL